MYIKVFLQVLRALAMSRREAGFSVKTLKFTTVSIKMIMGAVLFKKNI